MAEPRPIQSVYREATRAAVLGLVVNLCLGLTKLIGGLAGHSFALLSDALNSFGDVLTSAVVLFAFHVAQRPADKEHPYGHTRAEAIAASNVALLVMLSALWIGWQASQRVTLRHATPAAWTLGIAGLNVAIKEGLYQYKIRVGKRSGSAAIIANAWDHRSDGLCSLAVLVGLAVIRVGGPDFLFADELAALVVAAAIAWAGAMLFYKSVHELMDVQADRALVQAITQSAAAVEGVCGVEKLWVRKTGLEYLADIHIEVDAKLTVAEGHQIGHLVKDRLLGTFSNLRDVLVHLEPYPHDHSVVTTRAEA